MVLSIEEFSLTAFLPLSAWACSAARDRRALLAGCGRKGALDLPPPVRRDPTAGRRPPRSRRRGRRTASDGKPTAPAGPKTTPSSIGCSTERAMHHFAYRDGVLHAEAVNLATLARRSARRSIAIPPPRWSGTIGCSPSAFADVRALVCYAIKANSNQAVIATSARLGAGADVVSEGELKRARAAGIPPEKSCSPASARRARELALAVDEGILCVNVESEAELALLSSIAAGKGRSAHISMRVNPDVDAKTHAKIATGKAENKFGIPISRARAVYAAGRQAAGHQGRRRRHAYRQPDHRSRPVRRRLRAARRFRARCCAATATRSRMSISAAAWAFPTARTTSRRPTRTPMRDVVKRATRGLDCTLIFEPGRLIVGNAGILVTRVLYRQARRGQELRRRRRRA